MKGISFFLCSIFFHKNKGAFHRGQGEKEHSRTGELTAAVDRHALVLLLVLQLQSLPRCASVVPIV